MVGCQPVIDCFLTTQDWWNAESLQNFLRSWNPIVHDWLKAYMQPTLKKLVPQPLATMVIIVMSAFEHDFLFSTGIGYFIPLYMVEYGICGIYLLGLKLKVPSNGLRVCIYFHLNGSILLIMISLSDVYKSIACSRWMVPLRQISPKLIHT